MKALALTIAVKVGSVLVGLCALILGGIMLIRFFMLYPSNKKFERMGKETTAVIVGGREHHSIDNVNGAWIEHSPTPIVEYFDSFRGEKVRRMVEPTIRIRFPNKIFPTEPIKVQYTEKKVRISDERYVNISHYTGKRHGITAIICGIDLFACFVSLVCSIVSPGA